MVYTSVEIAPYLAEYVYAIYGCDVPVLHVRFPDKEYLYHVIYNMMVKRPVNAPSVDRGNLTIALPCRSRGKDPLVYNYLSERSVKVIENKIYRLFFAHMHDFVDEQVYTFHQPISESVYMFMNKYFIDSISHETLLKSYYRWRQKCRQRITKRKYDKSR